MSSFCRIAVAALAVFACCQQRASAAQQAGKPPNILFVILDDWSFPDASIYGSTLVETPGFDRVAREGVLFKNAFVASPGCSPSRAAILTGKQPWQLEHAGTHASSFSANLVVYTNLLSRLGYFVGLTGKGWGPGNFQITGWKNNPAGPAYNRKTLTPLAKGMSKNDYAGNFRDFLTKRPKGAPFCFWVGTGEPHRPFEKGAGLTSGKKLASVKVPAYLPDTKEIRSDLLDYAVEVEWADSHLVRMLQILEEMGELDNTIIVVTGDNGLAFPRAKANLYDAGFHVPLAIRWGERTKGGRVVDDLVSMIDLAPTYLEAARMKDPPPMTGKSLMTILASTKSGIIEPARDKAFAGRERHSSSRVKNQGYPCRAIRTKDYLLIRNFAPERWPAGDPAGFKNDAFGYYDIDACPTKTFLWEHRDDAKFKRFFDLAVAKRPAIELFDLAKDPDCLSDVAGKAAYALEEMRLRKALEEHLRATKDPHLFGNGAIFETYKRYSPIRTFPGDGKESSELQRIRPIEAFGTATESTQDAVQKKRRIGALVGVVTDKGNSKDGKNGWVEVKADGEENGRRYWPAGDPKVGGPNRMILAAIRKVAVGTRVRLEWVDAGDGKDITKFEVLKAGK